MRAIFKFVAAIAALSAVPAQAERIQLRDKDFSVVQPGKAYVLIETGSPERSRSSAGRGPSRRRLGRQSGTSPMRGRRAITTMSSSSTRTIATRSRALQSSSPSLSTTPSSSLRRS